METALKVCAQVGSVVRFDYPRHNYRGIPKRPETRRLLITQPPRDTHETPLDPFTIESNPLLNRGRWLVTGLDLDKWETRTFYLESMWGLEVVEPGDEGILPELEMLWIDSRDSTSLRFTDPRERYVQHFIERGTSGRLVY
jgi:hypothetical protein